MKISGKTVVIGVTGGISAYWSTEIIGILRDMSADIHVIMTENATKFITPLTLQTISKNKVSIDMFDLPYQFDIGHITYAKKSDLILITPATANFIGKIANGIADDLLTTTVMATRAPVLIAPAMNEDMWKNPIVQDNVNKLKRYGYNFVEPEYGKMACGGEGEGTLANIEKIIDAIKKLKE